MGSLRTIVDRALVNIRGQNQFIYAQKDAQLLGTVNTILAEVHEILQSIESNMVYSHGTISLADGTGEYTPSFSFESIMDEGVWLDDSADKFLVQGNEVDKMWYDTENTTGEPETYYITEGGDIGFLWIPDDSYTANVLYFTPLTELTDIDSDDLPWNGIWNRFIQDALEMKLKRSQERNVTIEALSKLDSYSGAIAKTYKRGVRSRRVTSDFFSLEGM